MQENDQSFVSAQPVYAEPESRRRLPLIIGLVTPLIIILIAAVYYVSQSPQQEQPTGDGTTAFGRLTPVPSVTQVPTPTSQIPNKPEIITSGQQAIYDSEFEKLSFAYPTTWKVSPATVQANYPSADSVMLTSPSGTITISWIAAMDGLGGGCDDTVPVEDPAGCPLYEVLETEELVDADLYYVAYVYTTDGINYSPAFALQDKDGLLSARRTMGYLLFKGKNSTKLPAGFMSGIPPYGRGLPSMSRAQAIEFFSQPEALEAKAILMSVTYMF